MSLEWETLTRAIKTAREWERAQFLHPKIPKINLRSPPERDLLLGICNISYLERYGCIVLPYLIRLRFLICINIWPYGRGNTSWTLWRSKLVIYHQTPSRATQTRPGSHHQLRWTLVGSSPIRLTWRSTEEQTHVSSACMAEALAAREAFLHASSLGYTKIWFWSDSQVIMRAVNQKRGPTELFGVLSDIIYLSSFFQFCRFTFFSRSLNGLVDSISKAQLCNWIVSWTFDAL